MDIFAIRQFGLYSAVGLTLAERRLYNYLLRNAINDLPNRLEFSINLKKLQGVFCAGQPAAERVKQALSRLLNTRVEFLLQEEKRQIWHVTTLLANAVLDLPTNELTYSYSPTMQIILTQPVLLERCLIQAHFSYKYSALLYELLSEQYYQNHENFYVEMTALRKALRVDTGKMINFADFNRSVLQPAIGEINSYAGFTIQYIPKHQGRKIIGLHFTCTPKLRRVLGSTADVIPPARPRLFIESPGEERVYAALLNAKTPDRVRFFKLAQRRAKRVRRRLSEDDLDRPDVWYDLVIAEVLAHEFTE